MNDVAQFSRSVGASKALLDKDTSPRRSRSGLTSRRPKPSQHYFAFLSYSHSDQQVAEWLHEAIENFRVPRRLVGRLTENGMVPRRLTPVFRDRGELAAADDLGEEIEEALAGSRFMIVLCSPAAVASRWASKEIVAFKRLHPDGCIFAAIIAGEPFASDIPGREAEECFPPALREKYDRRGRPTGKRAEPIAADLRAEGDGKQLGLMKIIAGMLDVGLDDLVQREGQRRQKRLALIAAASIAGMALTSGLALTAIESRDSARDQRREAEGLIGFMLGDLREKLEPIGKIEVLDSVGARVLAYYESQDKTDLPDAALAQRSKALTLMGEMANTRGELDVALRYYREAMAGTGEALRRVSNDPQRMFEHAQNVFWVGYIDYQRGRFDRAAAAFREYGTLADRMIALAPANPEYRLERLYADGALGAVQMDQRRYRDAASNFQSQVELAEALVSSNPNKVDYQMQLSNALGWLADARERNGLMDDAIAHRERQLGILARMWTSNPGNTNVKRTELAARRSLARLYASRGQMREAFEQVSLNSAVLGLLTKTEPKNTEWTQTGAGVSLEQAELQLAAGRLNEARQSQEVGCAAGQRLLQRDRTVELWRSDLQKRCATMRARLALRTGEAAVALAEARRLLVLARTERDPVGRAMSMASANLLLGAALAASGQRDAARGAFQAGVAAWPRNIEEAPSDLARKAKLFDLAGRDSRAIRERLTAMGYRHPDYPMKLL